MRSTCGRWLLARGVHVKARLCADSLDCCQKMTKSMLPPLAAVLGHNGSIDQFCATCAHIVRASAIGSDCDVECCGQRRSCVRAPRSTRVCPSPSKYLSTSQAKLLVHVLTSTCENPVYT